jgi:hypothetical protein
MAKVHDEWLTAFEAWGTTLAALAALSMPIQLVAGTNTTRAARDVVEVLRSIWPGPRTPRSPAPVTCRRSPTRLA